MAQMFIQDRAVHTPGQLARETFPAGTVIFEEGSSGKIAYVVSSGLVELFKTTEDGEIVIGYAGAGDIFGEMAPIDAAPRMASARTIKETECILISETVFRDKLRRTDPFIRDILRVLAGSLRATTVDDAADQTDDAETSAALRKVREAAAAARADAKQEQAKTPAKPSFVATTAVGDAARPPRKPR